MTRTEQILALVREKGIIRACDLKERNISRNYLYKLCQEGILERTAKGLYILSNSLITEHRSLIELTKQIPKAVICLISALSFHQLTTQLPSDVWIALPKGSWKPKIAYPPLNVSLFSNSSYLYGIEEHNVCNNIIKVYSVAKTIADCFKFRNKVCLDVAIESLQEGLFNKKVSINELVEAAEVNRVLNVMKPYLEALV